MGFFSKLLLTEKLIHTTMSSEVDIYNADSKI